MNPCIFYFVTPTLEAVGDYVLCNKLFTKNYLRTPFVYIFFHLLFLWSGSNHVIFKTLIYERWFGFLYKIGFFLKQKQKQKQKRVTFDLQNSE